MQIVIPMAGHGDRFRRAGHRVIKPLIMVDGKPIIEHVTDLFPGEDDFLFICNREHLRDTDLAETLKKLKPSGRIVSIESHKLGPVHTALSAEGYIRDDVPVILNYCDFSAVWDYIDFRNRMAEIQCDGCITAYRGFHPHSLGPNLYAYMREKDGYMLEIQEKHAFTENKMNEYASAGTYYFRRGALLKKYFRRAVDENITTMGEFFASMPYNLMVEDGLSVFIYPLEKFLQWGTPEDLEEYMDWSDYFRNYYGRKREMPVLKGVNLIPMAGAGRRFAEEGYVKPKPLIDVAGKTMISRSLGSLPSARKWILVMREEYRENESLQREISEKNRVVEPVYIDYLTEGQACTCLLARGGIAIDEPLLIGPCDAEVAFDPDIYAKLTEDEETDCIVWTFRNHPHANRYPRQYGWVRTDENGLIQGISCKVPISETVEKDPGIIGIFWFRRADIFTRCADLLIGGNIRINNEFYVDSVVDVAVESGYKCRVFDVAHYVGFGTPDDVKTFEYWQEYFTCGKNQD